MQSPPETVQLQERYQRFMGQPMVQAFVSLGGTVTIATEGRSTDQIMALVKAGQRHFAEKYLQEAAGKTAEICSGQQEVRWHYFGRLQRDKIRRALRMFSVVETLASVKEARRLAACVTSGEPVPDLLVQVNQGQEPQKNGVRPEQARSLIESVIEFGLPLKGLMTIPPKNHPPAPYFRALRNLADEYALPFCQMGFSSDFEQAIECGATHIRIGRKIFEPHLVA